MRRSVVQCYRFAIRGDPFNNISVGLDLFVSNCCLYEYRTVSRRLKCVHSFFLSDKLAAEKCNSLISCATERHSIRANRLSLYEKFTNLSERLYDCDLTALALLANRSDWLTLWALACSSKWRESAVLYRWKRFTIWTPSEKTAYYSR